MLAAARRPMLTRMMLDVETCTPRRRRHGHEGAGCVKISVGDRAPCISTAVLQDASDLLSHVACGMWYVGQVVESKLKSSCRYYTRNILTVTSWTMSASSSHIRNSAEETTWRMSPPHPLPSFPPLLLPMSIQLLCTAVDVDLLNLKKTNKRQTSPVLCMILAGVMQTGIWVTFLNRREPRGQPPGASKRSVQEGVGLRERPERVILHLSAGFKT